VDAANDKQRHALRFLINSATAQSGGGFNMWSRGFSRQVIRDGRRCGRVSSLSFALVAGISSRIAGGSSGGKAALSPWALSKDSTRRRSNRMGSSTSGHTATVVVAVAAARVSHSSHACRAPRCRRNCYRNSSYRLLLVPTRRKSCRRCLGYHQGGGHKQLAQMMQQR
jgi:hypothetical protein